MLHVATYRVFVSGPVDVLSDMQAIEQMISDINIVCEALGTRFDIFDWSKVTPGLSAEPQDRINKTAEGYDVLISVMGARLGTPTSKHRSGTVEEIENAIMAAERSPFGDESVLVFFKNVTLDSNSPHLLDAVEVQKYRRELSDRKVMYKQYSDDETLRLSVLRALGVLIRKHITRTSTSSLALVADVAEDDVVQFQANDLVPVGEEESGLIDYMILGSELLQTAGERVLRVTSAAEVLGAQLSAWSESVQGIDAANNPHLARQLISEIAGNIHDCGDEIRINVTGLSEIFSAAMDAYEAAVGLQLIDFKSDDTEEQKVNLLVTLSSMLVQVGSASHGIAEMMAVVFSLPRMTSNLNAAKRHLSVALENTIESLAQISARTEEMQRRLS